MGMEQPTTFQGNKRDFLIAWKTGYGKEPFLNNISWIFELPVPADQMVIQAIRT